MVEQRRIPVSELDFNYMVVDTKWGKDDIPQSLKDLLTKKKAKVLPKGVFYTDEENNTRESDGTIIVTETVEHWGKLGIYTQDMRLGNLSRALGEHKHCQYYTDLAQDLISSGMTKSGSTSLSRTASVLELSQSANGFLRKNMREHIRKETSTINEMPKKSLFGAKKQKQY